MKKKILKIVGIVVLLFVVTLIAAPFFLKGKIADIIKNKVNNSITATLEFEDADLTLFSSFPNAKVTLNNISIVNKEPFLGDTLFSSKEIALDMSIKELFKGADEPIAISSLMVDGALINIEVNEQGIANYDIAKETEEVASTAADEEPSNFTFSMESYALTNSKIIYADKLSGMRFELENVNHSGNGDLSLEKSELDTKTSGLVSFEMDSTNYLNKNPIQLDALLGVDLATNTYSFLKNEAILNQLPLVFDGFIKINDNNQELDVSFKTPSSDFKNFLAVIPETYSKNIENVTTTGNFMVAGRFNGVVDETHIPKFNIEINSDNASFKYPDLPKSVRNVFIDTKINNETGIVDDTYVDINKLSFMIDEDKFNMVAKIRDLMGNTKVSAHIDGNMNLANIAKAYPVPSDLNLEGLLNANVDAAFDMASIEKEQYEKTNIKGNLNLKNFVYKSEELKNPVKINSTSVTFNPQTVTLNELSGVTGATDFNAVGTINNLLGFMFNDENVQGDFTLKSNTFSVNDFMVEEAVSEKETTNDKPVDTTTEAQIKIPSFLDANIKASAATVLYDNLTLKNVSGNLIIKDEKATLQNMTSSIFDGKLGFNGEVSTKGDTPTFAMKLGMESLKINETFKSLELFKVLAPIANAIQGNLNSDIIISGNLNNDFTPNLATISGNVLAELLGTEIKPEQTQVLSALSSKLSFLNLDNLNLKGLKTALSFENGTVKVKPFTVNYQDIAIKIDGSHTFDQKLSYGAVIDVPAKYLGNDIANLISKIDDKSLEGLTIPVTANIGGNYTSPQVSTDLTSGVKTLTTKLVEIEKQKLISKGKDKASELLGGLLSGTNKTNDTTATAATTTEQNKEAVKNALGGLLGGAKKDTTAAVVKDTTAASKNDAVKEAAKSVLGGLFSKKKTDE
ncbi:AsmA family protein [Cellulophaga sp. HaHaR_3_176]|uniref:AsmA-like C-terminal region-containing protein n=1 Tax=Cellulophaga sp. HaHaR_3_176 TaxID=1942464 RepID=UPI001C1F371D|nr:AsmA-like C-terminal region-containing protein [Cellulophaga sp. HaHaR_3_176]QWX84109.1 AsmA family protein [Cellulophaga sp. HaHaR_3_176]